MRSRPTGRLAVLEADTESAHTAPRRLSLLLLVCSLMLSAPALALDAKTMAEVRALQSRGQNQQASQILERWLVDHPEDVDAVFMLTDMMLDARRFDQAVRRLVGLKRMRSKDQRVASRLASVYELIGWDDQSAAELERLSALTPKDPQPFERLVRLYERSGRIEDAAASLDNLVRLLPRNIGRWLHLARLREGLQHYRDALVAYETAAFLDSNSAVVWRKVAWLRSQVSLETEAAEAWLQALRLQPDHVPSQRALANVYAWTDNNVERIKVLRGLVRVAPNDANAHEQLARALVEKDEPRGAAAQYERVLELLPERSDIRLRLALLYEAEGEHARALDQLDRVQRDKPHDADQRRMRARIYEARGDKVGALALYRGILADDPGDEVVAEKMEGLDIAVAPTVHARYDLEQSRVQTRHMLTLMFEHEPTRFLRYRGGYVYALARGDSFIDNRVPLESESHGGFGGLTLRLAPRTLLDLDIYGNGYNTDLRPEAFFGARVGVRQTWNRGHLKAWIARREGFTTLDATIADTIVHDVHLELRGDFPEPFFLEASAFYGHWRYTDRQVDERLGNNGFGWRGALGVGLVDDPVLFELILDYTGRAFEQFNEENPRIPYFAPDLYQTLGLTAYLEHEPHWRFKYSLFARPAWIFRDEAIQVSYGGQAEVKLHRRHRLTFRFERTDTPFGATDVIFDENRLMAMYTGVF
ncbi:MAG: tetratricopeptide (TPR) repeat protein [Myxococcota bacterium]|jgi:tetratricopeptide (TPR) repeat protein